MEKKISKATPFVDANGNVTKWEMTLTYSLNDYEVNFYVTKEPVDVKKPSDFFVNELWAMADENYWDDVFDSMYESTHADTPAPETKVDGFDVDSLK